MTGTIVCLLFILSPAVVLTLDDELPKYNNSLEPPIERSVLGGDNVREQSDRNIPDLRKDGNINSEPIKKQEFAEDLHAERWAGLEPNTHSDVNNRKSSNERQIHVPIEMNDQHLQQPGNHEDKPSRPNDNIDRRHQNIPTPRPVDPNRPVNDGIRSAVPPSTGSDVLPNDRRIHDRAPTHLDSNAREGRDPHRISQDYHGPDPGYRPENNQPRFDPRHHPEIPGRMDRLDRGQPNPGRMDFNEFAPDPYIEQERQQQRPRSGSRQPYSDNIFQLPSIDTEQNTFLPGNTFVSLIMQLFSATKQCIYYTPVSDFIIDYQVIRGGMLDLGILVKDPNGEPIIAQPPSADDTFSIKVPPHFHMRSYAICLDNRKASYAVKYVSLSIDVDVNWDNPSPQDQALIDYIQKRSFGDSTLAAMDEQFTESTKALTTVLDRLFGRLRHIQSMQKKTDTLATVDKSLMEANMDRVVRGSVMQIFMLMAVCSVQVLLIRALFDPYSRLYRLWWGRRSRISARC